MMRAAWRVVVHLSCLLLVLPVGWCCWLPTSRANPSVVAEEKNDCCCAKKEKPAPVKPTKQDAPQAPACCCDPQPAAVLTLPDQSGKPSIDALPAIAIIPVAETSLAHVGIMAPVRFLFDPSPPLRVLHCAWLC